MERKALLELVFWIFTGLVAVAVLMPILLTLEEYPFLFINSVFIIVSITITRYLFLLQYTLIARRQIVKVALVFLFIPLIFYLIQELNYFQTFLDEEGPYALVGQLAYSRQESMAEYIHSEMLLFGTASVICAVAFPFRLIISVWRTRNRGTV